MGSTDDWVPPSEIPPPLCEIEKEMAEEIAALSKDQNAKWNWLIRRARQHLPQSTSLPDQKYLVKGCATPLYLVPHFAEGRVWFELNVDQSGDSPLLSYGLATVAQKLYSGQTAATILSSDPHFFSRVGLIEQLSPQRSNGFASLLKLMRLYATIFSKMERSE